MIFKSTVDLYVDAPDAQLADARVETILRTASYDLLDWTRAGTCYPMPATKGEIKAIEYFTQGERD
jgi:hypothetical protein